MKFLHDSQDVPIISPPHAMMRAMPGYNRGARAGHVVKPAENAGSTLFAAEMVLGEGAENILGNSWRAACRHGSSSAQTANYLIKLSN